MKVYAVYSEGMNVYTDQRVFKTKRAALRNLESFLACTIGHDAEIREIEKPSYDDLNQKIQQLEDALRDMEHELKNASKLLKISYSPLLADAIEIDDCLEKHRELLTKINEGKKG